MQGSTNGTLKHSLAAMGGFWKIFFICSLLVKVLSISLSGWKNAIDSGWLQVFVTLFSSFFGCLKGQLSIACRNAVVWAVGCSETPYNHPSITFSSISPFLKRFLSTSPSRMQHFQLNVVKHFVCDVSSWYRNEKKKNFLGPIECKYMYLNRSLSFSP